MADKIYRLAVIGCGDIALRGHLPAMDAHPRVRIDAVSDIDAGRMAAVCERYGVARLSADYREVVSLPEIDAVFVITPPWVTPEATVCALRAGKDVFCEKPMALTLDEARAVVEAERESGRKVLVGFKNTRSPLMEKLKERLDAGWFGAPLSYAISSFDETYDPDHEPEHYRRIRKALEYGSPMVGEGGHYADFIRYFTNGARPVRASAAGFRSRPEFAAPNHVNSLVQLANGDVVQIEVGWFYPSYFPGAIRVLGPGGAALLSRDRKTLTLRKGAAEEVVTMDEDWNDVCFRRQLDYFVDCLDRGAAPVPGTREGYNSLALTLALERSLTEGRLYEFDENEFV